MNMDPQWNAVMAALQQMGMHGGQGGAGGGPGDGLRQAPPQFMPSQPQGQSAFQTATPPPRALWQGGQLPAQPQQPMINPYGMGAFALGPNIGTTPQPNPKVLPTQIPTTVTTAPGQAPPGQAPGQATSTYYGRNAGI